jgi:hypothetical protein
MRFLMFIKHREDFRLETVPDALMAAMGSFVTDGFKNGWLKDTGGLQPTASAKRVRLHGGKLSVTDGPFTEAKEVIGGFAMIEAPTYPEAMVLATKFMELHRIHWPAFEGECEVRPLENNP